MKYLNLSRAAYLLADFTGDPSATDDTQAIIEAGAQGEIPIYWRNAAQVWTRLSDFKGDLKGTDSAARHMQLEPSTVAQLETAPDTTVLSFALTDQDYDTLTKLFGNFIDDDGYLLGYRHAIGDEVVTITRDQLRVHTDDLKAYAATLRSAELSADLPAPKAVVVDQVQAQAMPSACVVTTHSTKAKELDHIGQHLKKIVANLAHPTVDTVMVEFKELALAGVPPFTGGISTDESNKKQPKGSLLYVKGADVIGLKRRDIRERLDRLNDKK